MGSERRVHVIQGGQHPLPELWAGRGGWLIHRRCTRSLDVLGHDELGMRQGAGAASDATEGASNSSQSSAPCSAAIAGRAGYWSWSPSPTEGSAPSISATTSTYRPGAAVSQPSSSAAEPAQHPMVAWRGRWSVFQCL